MQNNNYIAFIVEGDDREPQIIENISKVFFSHHNFKIISLPAGNNIYMLWKKLKSDNFETDIIEVVREINDQSKDALKGLSRDDFSSVYLLFDYDPHQKNTERNLTEDIIKQMLESFDNETENAVMEAIDKLQKNKTLIIVAHRITTLKNCDKIYEIKDGKAFEVKKEQIL